MKTDASWTNNAQQFTMAACSGAWLQAAVLGDPDHSEDATPQLKLLDDVGPQNMIAMILGGNNCKFTPIAESCIYLGRSFNERKTCDQTFQDTEDYLSGNDNNAGKSFYFDHQKTLKDIMAWPSIKDNKDFRLYVFGYALFFNTNPDSDWCNDEKFSPLPLDSLKLDNAKRARINASTKKVNDLIEKSVGDLGDARVKFIPIDHRFDGHRFCEPGMTKNDQYYNNNVWFWNVSDPDQDPDYLLSLNPLTSAIEAIYRELWLNGKFPNGTAIDDAAMETLLSPNWGSQARTFHPKLGGNQAMKDALIAQLRADNAPGIKPAEPTPPPPKTQPYTSGLVHVHVREYWGCLPNEDNLSVEVNMWDSANKLIGTIKRTQAGATGPLPFGSKLEDYLVITPEWGSNGGDGYVQFSIGNLHFNTNDDKDKIPGCKIGAEGHGWDPRQGPTCADEYYNYPDAYAVNAHSILC